MSLQKNQPRPSGAKHLARYTYDAFDLLSCVTHPDGTALTFAYDKLTRLTAVTNATGETYMMKMAGGWKKPCINTVTGQGRSVTTGMRITS
ncbi:hypothetical protein GEA64_05555 [Photorhabdus khanii]|uniref:RHS repeat protein n=1 Tax=Photorhabdus khanii TaxID=1004150 RepID=A0A7C9GM10_9GAMM|nr:RHS repeat domain-containing protein [Photorhabdus khanii]MQL47490.1 hypothetical protein [Photorhabdus khanii]